MIRFDTDAPGGGMDAYVTVRSGKAEIEFVVYLTESGDGDVAVDAGKDASAKPDGYLHGNGVDRTGTIVDIIIFDEKEQEAARMRLKVNQKSGQQKDWEEKTDGQANAEKAKGHRHAFALNTRTLLIYPHLWRSTENPCLYRVKASVIIDGQVADTLETSCVVTSMIYTPERGFYLNEKPFALHGVRYPLTADWREHLDRDLALLKEVGANCICPDSFPDDRAFFDKCLENGFVIWRAVGGADNLPLFCGGRRALLDRERSAKTDSFYLWQARWSTGNVLHICMPDKVPGGGGNISVTVYSNQKRVALYVDGVLFEFKESAPVFVFEDVPVKGEPVVISAQAGERVVAVTV